MRALIVSDIHANLEALEAVLAAAEGLYDQIWNLGDLVGYGGAPNQVIERMRPLQSLVVRGNHDRVSCGLTSAEGFNPVARQAVLWTHDELTPANFAWLREVPQGPLCPAESGISCAHGSPLDEDFYILNMRDAWAPLQRMTTALTFFGHTHVQGGFLQSGQTWHELRPGIGHPENASDRIRNYEDSWVVNLEAGTRYLINPGSVGQPRDLDWRAAFALYTSEANGDEITRTLTFHRIPYDLVASQGRILMAGLPERLALRLREGR